MKNAKNIGFFVTLLMFSQPSTSCLKGIIKGVTKIRPSASAGQLSQSSYSPTYTQTSFGYYSGVYQPFNIREHPIYRHINRTQVDVQTKENQEDSDDQVITYSIFLAFQQMSFYRKKVFKS